MASVFRPALLAAAGLALLASPVQAQRPALTGEKARVAEAVRADLTKLSDLQTAHHARTKVYAADARDLNFVPTSGAQVNIAYASMNAWAANATHPTLSPVACFIIISAAEPTGPAAQPFCQEGRPGTTASATPPAAATPPTTAPAAPVPPPTQPTTPPRTQPNQPRTDPVPPPSQPPAANPVVEPQAQPPAQPTVTTTPPRNPPRQQTPPAVTPPPAQAPATPADVSLTPPRAAAPLRPPTVTPPTVPGGQPRTESQPSIDISVAARANTRDATADGAVVPSQVESVTATQFSERLAEFARGAVQVFFAQESDAVRVLRDPYESTPEFEARRAAAIAAARRREAEFLAQNSRTYTVSMPIRAVQYDADREVLEFTVDGVALPVARPEGDGPATLPLTCYTRPILWCSPEDGMLYEAGDQWRVPRGIARQHDVLRNPLVLYARFAVGRREDGRILGVTLLSMDLQARGQSVQRWDGGAR